MTRAKLCGGCRVILSSFMTQARWRKSGAGEGNRTLVLSLGSSCSTIELHPREAGLSSTAQGKRKLQIVGPCGSQSMSPRCLSAADLLHRGQTILALASSLTPSRETLAEAGETLWSRCGGSALLVPSLTPTARYRSLATANFARFERSIRRVCMEPSVPRHWQPVR